MGKKGFVYLVGDWDKEGSFKIGVTRGDVYKRIKKLQTGNSSEIYLVSSYETDYPFFIESYLHKKYSPINIRDEWFLLEDKQVLEFKKDCEEAENIIEALKDNPFFPKNLK